MLTFLLYVLFWYLSGIASFAYWWTKDFDLTSEHLGLMILVGIGGPISFVAGWTIHARVKLPATTAPAKIYLRKRN